MAATERFHERVTLEIDHRVAEVRLARPRAHNGLAARLAGRPPRFP
ncbi:MAG: hypothetical protein IBX53_11975 [Halomonas sp.]|nr:hypothetical protein [Halomonas sp.]MBE0489786.1 hypothetical protein [Halomonas sp.]